MQKRLTTTIMNLKNASLSRNLNSNRRRPIKWTGHGMKIWCRRCKKYRQCDVIKWPKNPYIHAPNYSGSSEPQRKSKAFDDIRWFHRTRQCRECADVFDTAEVNVELVH